MAVKIIFVALFFAATLLLGFLYQRKVRSMEDFVLGGRSVGPWLTAFSYGTSYFSAVVFIGYAGQFGWNFGISAFWVGLANALLGSLAGVFFQEIPQQTAETCCGADYFYFFSALFGFRL